MYGDGTLYRKPRSPFWHMQYYLRGRRFSETTKERDYERALKGYCQLDGRDFKNEWQIWLVGSVFKSPNPQEWPAFWIRTLAYAAKWVYSKA
jgi:hypothetical protein